MLKMFTNSLQISVYICVSPIAANMENLIPVIVMVAIFLVQAYNNYKKEQEKAKKRAPGKSVPRPDFPRHPAPENQPRQAAVAPAPLNEPSSTLAENPYQAYQGVVSASDRPGEGSSSLSQATGIKPLEIETDMEQEASEAGADEDMLYRLKTNFDVREAVVMAAILERRHF